MVGAPALPDPDLVGEQSLGHEAPGGRRRLMLEQQVHERHATVAPRHGVQEIGVLVGQGRIDEAAGLERDQRPATSDQRPATSDQRPATGDAEAIGGAALDAPGGPARRCSLTPGTGGSVGA
jgi:hypothetical protein